MGLGQFLQRGFGEIVNPTNPIGQLGKALSQASGTTWGDALTALDQQKRQSQQDEMQRQIQQAQLAALTAKTNRNQIVQLPNGGIAAVDPDTNQLQMLRNPEAPAPHKTPLQENNEYISTLKPGTPEYDRAVPGMQGYQFDPTVMAAKFNQQMALRQAPTYAATHPKPGGLGGSRFGRTKANPMPIKGEGDLATVPVGTWVSPHPGVVFQVR